MRVFNRLQDLRHLGTRTKFNQWRYDMFCDKNLPAHRVVNRDGLLTGKMHFSGPDEMAERLRAEGIVVINDQIQNFEKHFWDPSTELGLA